MTAAVRFGEDIAPVLQCQPVDPARLLRLTTARNRKSLVSKPAPDVSVFACDTCGARVWIGPHQLAVRLTVPGAVVRCYVCLIRGRSTIYP